MLRLFIQIDEVRKMNWNIVGKHVRKTTDDLLSKILGVIKPNRSAYSKILRKSELVGNVYPDVQTERILLEIELKNSRAIQFVRRFQNR